MNQSASLNVEETPVMYATQEMFEAVRNYSPDRLIMAIINGVDINAFDNTGERALHILLSRVSGSDDWLSCLNLFLGTGVDVNAANDAGDSALHVVFCENNTRSEQDRIRALKVADVLIEHGADVNACNAKGEMPVHRAIWRQCYDFYKTHIKYGELDESMLVPGPGYNLNGWPERLILLLDSGLRPGTLAAEAMADRYRKIYYPSDKSIRPKVLKLLLEAGMDPCSIVGNCGDTLLHVTCRSTTATDDICLLVEAGADVKQKNDKGETPLQMLHSHGPWMRSKKLADYLGDTGTDD